MPQYGKYKVKAAHTEVKATLSNLHAAQALHMVENNEYAATLAAIDVPTPGGTYVFGNVATVTASSATTILDNFNLQKAAGTADTSVFHIYASAKKKLAGCASNSTAPFDVWCLDYNKHMSNKDAQRGECLSASAQKLVDGSC